MDRYNSILVFLLFSVGFLSAQDIAFYADVMVNASDADHRRYAADQFDDLLIEKIEAEGAFQDSLIDLPYLITHYADDGKFRTVTWQIDEGEGRFRYDGIIQLADGTYHRVAGPRGRKGLSESGTIKWDQWQGALIYDIISTRVNGTIQYYLLSYRQTDPFTKTKTIEKVDILDKGVELGTESVFINSENGDKKSRLVLQYSADMISTVSYQPDAQQFVYDNLIPVQGRMEGQGTTLVPDGSYKAYIFQEDGTWKYKDKLFNQTFVKPPRGGISTKGRDIIGKPKKN